MAITHGWDQPHGFDAILDRDDGTVIVALDFDGVVNAARPKWPERPRKKHVRTSVGEFLIVWAPSLRDHIKALAVQLVWLTSWGPEIHVVEDLLGLPRLPHAINTLLPSADVPAVQHAAIAEIAATGRPWIWCDDNEAENSSGPTEHGPHLEIRPKSKHGLTPDDIERIWDFIDNPYAVRSADAPATEARP
ncbi:hypothetical protein LO763_19805 [Glycomyces sp. A-F 0318]|uniref:HAD domain-containing protein n=1 Tax=Glycomyces amatae TaxID=2881355 RepID=UPI001E5B02F7|nr:HAD domain-containing protein [Glycomyces amatae]MCD0445858.1 hypothetical protein [Glycomyces amatae]